MKESRALLVRHLERECAALSDDTPLWECAGSLVGLLLLEGPTPARLSRLQRDRRIFRDASPVTASPEQLAWLALLLGLAERAGLPREAATRFGRLVEEALLAMLSPAETDEELLALCFVLLVRAGSLVPELEERVRMMRERAGGRRFSMTGLLKCARMPVRDVGALRRLFEQGEEGKEEKGRLLATALWGMAGSRVAFEEHFLWLVARPQLWQQHPQYVCFALALRESHRVQQPQSLQDVIVVGHNKTHLRCPLCGVDVLDLECDEEEGGEGENSCALHEAVRRFNSGSRSSVAPLVGMALQQLPWPDTDKAQLLEVFCGVTGMHELRTVTKNDLFSNAESGRVQFDTTSFDKFRPWLLDKLARSQITPYFRFGCAMRIREVWRQNPHGRQIFKQLEEAKLAAEPVQAHEVALRERIVGINKGIAGISKFLERASEEKKAPRQVMLEEKLASLAVAEAELEALLFNNATLEALKRAELEWETFLRVSGLGVAMDELTSYNMRVAAIRSGSVGKEGQLFENECLGIVDKMFNPTNDPEIRVLRSVKLPGVQFPEFASSEFDFWVVRGNEVLTVIEMKRSTGAVRGNLLKKLSAMNYLLSEAFEGNSLRRIAVDARLVSSLRVCFGLRRSFFRQHVFFSLANPSLCTRRKTCLPCSWTMMTRFSPV